MLLINTRSKNFLFNLNFNYVLNKMNFNLRIKKNFSTTKFLNQKNNDYNSALDALDNLISKFDKEKGKDYSHISYNLPLMDNYLKRLNIDVKKKKLN
jgi:hypothetical protein